MYGSVCMLQRSPLITIIGGEVVVVVEVFKYMSLAQAVDTNNHLASLLPSKGDLPQLSPSGKGGVYHVIR